MCWSGFFRRDGRKRPRSCCMCISTGSESAAIFTYEVAETKVTQVMDFARKHQHPLQCVMEKK